MSELEFSTQKFDEVNSSLTEAKSSSERLIQEKDELFNQNAAFVVELKAEGKEIQTLTSKLAGLECQMKLKENEVTKLNEHNNSVTKLLEAKKNEDQKAAHAHLGFKLKETTDTHLKLSGDLEAMKSQLKEANELNEITKIELESLKSAEKKTEEKHTALTNKQIEDLEAQNRALLNKSLKLKITEAKYDSTMSKLEEMKQQAESCKHDLVQENAKNDSFADEKECFKGTVASLSEFLKTSKKFEEMKEE